MGPACASTCWPRKPTPWRKAGSGTSCLTYRPCRPCAVVCGASLPSCTNGAAAAEDDGGEEADDSEAEDELKRFRRWYKKRIGADVDLFESVKLAKSAKLLVADEVLRMSWETYP